MVLRPVHCRDLFRSLTVRHFRVPSYHHLREPARICSNKSTNLLIKELSNVSIADLFFERLNICLPIYLPLIFHYLLPLYHLTIFYDFLLHKSWNSFPPYCRDSYFTNYDRVEVNNFPSPRARFEIPNLFWSLCFGWTWEHNEIDNCVVNFGNFKWILKIVCHHKRFVKRSVILLSGTLLTDLHQVTTALDNRRREEKESLNPVMQQLEAQTKSFQAMTERLSSNILADFEVMLQKQLSSSIEG